jgi:hypothetical protein
MGVPGPDREPIDQYRRKRSIRELLAARGLDPSSFILVQNYMNAAPSTFNKVWREIRK